MRAWPFRTIALSSEANSSHVNLVSILRQLYAQDTDDALRVALDTLLVPDADRLVQTIIIDPDAAAQPDDHDAGDICFRCLQ